MSPILSSPLSVVSETNFYIVFCVIKRKKTFLKQETGLLRRQKFLFFSFRLIISILTFRIIFLTGTGAFLTKYLAPFNPDSSASVAKKIIGYCGLFFEKYSAKAKKCRNTGSVIVRTVKNFISPYPQMIVMGTEHQVKQKSRCPPHNLLSLPLFCNLW